MFLKIRKLIFFHQPKNFQKLSPNLISIGMKILIIIIIKKSFFKKMTINIKTPKVITGLIYSKTLLCPHLADIFCLLSNFFTCDLYLKLLSAKHRRAHTQIVYFTENGLIWFKERKAWIFYKNLNFFFKSKIFAFINIFLNV